VKYRLWEVQYTYRDLKRSYRQNGSLSVFANSFDEAAATAIAKIPEIMPGVIEPIVMGIQHRGEKTVVWASELDESPRILENHVILGQVNAVREAFSNRLNAETSDTDCIRFALSQFLADRGIR
jgi:hypothetical protein